MTVYNNQIEEYLWYATYLQGNVNVPGLVFDDLLYEYINLQDVIYTVNVDLVESGFDLTESQEPLHLLVIKESLSFSEIFGFPSRVKQVAINVIHEPIVSPVELCHMQIDIVQGVDVFWDEVSDGLHFPTESDSFAIVGLLYYGNCFESLGVDFEVAEGTSGVWKAVYSYAEDLINNMHEVEALWYFNNLSVEQLFVYDSPLVGWQHNVLDGFVITDNARRYLGFKLVDWLICSDSTLGSWRLHPALTDTLFAWDASKTVQGWTEFISEFLAAVDNSASPLFEKLTDILMTAGSLDETIGKSTIDVLDTLIINDAATILSKAMILIQETIRATSVFTGTIDYQSIVEDGITIETVAVANHIIEQIIADAFSSGSSILISGIVSALVSEEISYEFLMSSSITRTLTINDLLSTQASLLNLQRSYVIAGEAITVEDSSSAMSAILINESLSIQGEVA